MLDATLKQQLSTYLQNVTQPIEIVAYVDDGAKSAEMLRLLNEIAALSAHIALTESRDAALRQPSFAINRPGEDTGIRFAGLPMGHEFTSLVLALLHVGGHPPKAEAERDRADQSGRWRLRLRQLHFAVLPELPRGGAGAQPDGGAQPAHPPHHGRRRAVSRTKSTSARSSPSLPSISTVKRSARDAWPCARSSPKSIPAPKRATRRSLAEKDPFDVLIVGGGPAGAAAAIYAARKGIRTGVVSERFGGQVMDTLGIENFISVQHTEGPKLVAALEQHVRQYDVDIIDCQRAAALVPAAAVGDMAAVQLAGGATLHARAVILATGARWRELDVPGEREYRGRAWPIARTATGRCSRASMWR